MAGNYDDRDDRVRIEVDLSKLPSHLREAIMSHATVVRESPSSAPSSYVRGSCPSCRQRQDDYDRGYRDASRESRDSSRDDYSYHN